MGQREARERGAEAAVRARSDPFHPWKLVTWSLVEREGKSGEGSQGHRIWVQSRAPNLVGCGLFTLGVNMGMTLSTLQGFIFGCMIMMLGTGNTFCLEPVSERIEDRIADIFIWYTPEKVA